MVAVILFLLRVLARLPLPILHAFGAVIGLCFYFFPNKRRSTTFTNLKLCFPHLNPVQMRRLARASLIETGKGLVETSTLWLGKKQQILDRIKQIDGVDDIRSAASSGKGVILVAPHLGCWEMIGLYCSMEFHLTSLYRPPPMAEMELTMRQARERFGANLVPTDRSGIKALFHGLESGGAIGILPDQDPGTRGGVFAPFFGIPANTMTLLSRLASKTGSEVFFCYAVRLPKGRGYHLHFIKGSKEINNADMVTSATAINRGIEECIRSIPEQYLWCYKRFRTRPQGESKLYHR